MTSLFSLVSCVFLDAIEFLAALLVTQSFAFQRFQIFALVMILDHQKLFYERPTLYIMTDIILEVV